MALILRTFGQRCFLKQCLSNNHLRFVPIATSAVVKQQEDFFQKNDRLARPISPHLTIYAPQITWLLSITHRVTGVMLSGVGTSLAVGMLMWPGNFATYLQWVESFHFGSGCIFVAKLSLAFPFMFHLLNGIRHLFWDMGQGFDLKTVTMTGYAVLVLSSLLSLGLASM